MSCIELHIEHLVLDGLHLYPAERAALVAALEGELARRLAVGEIDAPGGAIPRVVAPPVNIARPVDAARLGVDIARSIYAGIAGSAGVEARRDGRP